MLIINTGKAGPFYLHPLKNCENRFRFPINLYLFSFDSLMLIFGFRGRKKFQMIFEKEVLLRVSATEDLQNGNLSILQKSLASLFLRSNVSVYLGGAITSEMRMG